MGLSFATAAIPAFVIRGTRGASTTQQLVWSGNDRMWTPPAYVSASLDYARREHF